MSEVHACEACIRTYIHAPPASYVRIRTYLSIRAYPTQIDNAISYTYVCARVVHHI